MDLTLIVLAAGLGSRYGGLKQLEAVGPGGETLLDYGIYDAVRAGYSRAVLVIRPELESAFREHVERRYGDSIEIGFAIQSIDQVPEGVSVPVERRKPWGTGHAALAARSEVSEPFVVMNADDFYGRTAYEALADHLRRHADTDPLNFAAAGYELNATLSPHGGVSRAVCNLDDQGYLVRVTEVKRIRREADVLVGVTVAGEPIWLNGDETVSMNLWAATPAAFPILEQQFARFLDDHAADPESEFFLSEAVNEQVAAGTVRVKVIPTPGPWLGVTYPEDRDHVVERLRELAAAGIYPSDIP
jgi:NDP-sugar pyrophosphorylase family protein